MQAMKEHRGQTYRSSRGVCMCRHTPPIRYILGTGDERYPLLWKKKNPLRIILYCKGTTIDPCLSHGNSPHKQMQAKDNVSHSAATSFPFNFQSSQEGTEKLTATANAQQLLPARVIHSSHCLCSQLDFKAAPRRDRDLSQVQFERARWALHMWPGAAITCQSFSSATSHPRWDQDNWLNATHLNSPLYGGEA